MFLDMQMPGLGGVEALQTLRLWPQTRQLPVIVMTASSEEVTVRRCVALGVSAYLIKPIHPPTVALRLTALLPSLGLAPAAPVAPAAPTASS
jgi:CheY-like chemotaxis protein